MAAQCRNPLKPISETPPTNEATSIEVSTPVISETGDQPRDLLDMVQERGFLKVGVRVWPDANFTPPLFRSPLAGLDGYEVDLAWALADHLGVGLEMAESDPRRIAGGDWQGEWDIALAWLPITDQAQQHLIFSVPYAYDAGAILVHDTNKTITRFDTLSGQKIGIPALTIYQQILRGEFPSVHGEFVSGPLPPELEIIPYNRDGDTIRDLAKGNGVILDAVLHSHLILKTAVKAGMPVKIVSKPLFWVPIGVGFDRRGMPAERLRVAIDETITLLHNDRSLSNLSIEWYGEDITRVTLPSAGPLPD